MKVIQPRDLFVRGHDLYEGSYDDKGYWSHKEKTGTYLWIPPPGAADVAVEESRNPELSAKIPHISLFAFVY